MAKKQDNNDKLICGRTARKYLNCSKAEFEILVKKGLIQACRDEYSRWRVSKDSVLNYAAKLHSSSESRLIINENHYHEVIERICEAKTSIYKISNGKGCTGCFCSNHLFQSLRIFHRRMAGLLSADGGT